ncbi:MAG: DUF11 domain-containing protein [Acidimicrobiia bacterium]|nr:DUF11 domain-containing protein [Acidimicrobiia bacterium]
MNTAVLRLLRFGAVTAGCAALLFLWGPAGGAEESADAPAGAEVAVVDRTPAPESAPPTESEETHEVDVPEEEDPSPPSQEPAVEQEPPPAPEEVAGEVPEPAPAPEPDAGPSSEPETPETDEASRLAAVESADPHVGDGNPGLAPSDVGCPECSSSITQALVEKTWQGDHWTIVIEATLDSNVVCHFLLLQCVVQPEQDPPDMTLTGVSCLSGGWAHVMIDVLGFSRNVCAKFNHHTAGQEPKFRFSYTTDQIGGQVSETVKFYRFPEELFVPPRAEDTITIDLGVGLLLKKSCPDTIEAGTNITCGLSVAYPAEPGGPPVMFGTLTELPPPEFVGGTLTADDGPWPCFALTCDILYMWPGDAWAFTYTAFVDTLADGTVENRARLTYDNGGGPQSVDAADDVTIYRPTDTFVTVTKQADQTSVQAGGKVSYTITVTNEGNGLVPVDATNVVVADVPPPGMVDAVLSFVSGVGTWQCGGVVCTAATMPVGATTFALSGTVGAAVPGGTVLLNEVDVRWENDVFGPDFTERAGAETTVTAAVIVPPADDPGSDTGSTRSHVAVAGLPFTGAGTGGGLSLLAVLVLLLGGSLLGLGTRVQRVLRDGA